MTVRVDYAALRRRAMDLAREEVQNEANRLRNQLVRTTPRSSGRTANAWDVRIRERGEQVTAEIFNNVRADGADTYVWRLLHEGTGRYGPRHTDIVPVHRKVLRWRGGGRALSGSRGGYVFATRSRGFPPDDYIFNAVNSSTWRTVRNAPPGTRI